MVNLGKHKKNTKAKYFYRYTNLAAAIHLLKNKQITLLDPMSWDDKNEAFLMETYKERRNAKTVLALCFAEAAETYHHWKTFSNGPDGISINFEKDKLLSTFSRDNKIEHRHVRYIPMRKIETLSLDISELPFLKRYPFRAEKEYRVIYVDTEALTKPKNYDINLSWIKWIRLSPWMPEPFVESVKKALRSISGCKKLKIVQSRVIRSEKWKNIASQVK